MPRKTQTFHDYYWGKGPTGASFFRDDINRIVPTFRKRTKVDDTEAIVFEAGLLFPGNAGDFLKGTRRDLFLTALYFTILIDQGFHYYYRKLHAEYDRLTAPPKLGTTFLHVHPGFLLTKDFGWSEWTSTRLAIFAEAEEVFRRSLIIFAAKHFPELDPLEAWGKFSRHLPDRSGGTSTEC